MTYPKGNCYLCGAEVSKRGAKKHILAENAYEENFQECRLIKVEGYYNKNYYLYLDMSITSTLDSLDTFLRKIWLECCGHMSAFMLNQRSNYDEISFSIKIGAIPEGTRLRYEYDFGSTTTLLVTFEDLIWRRKQRNAVRLLVRNQPMEYACNKCGAKANWINSESYDAGEGGFLCDSCVEKTGIDENMLLPVTNSPRMGVCCYEGDMDVYAFQLKEKKRKRTAKNVDKNE